MILLNEIVYDERARNGIWCKIPYPDHPKGCPNFPHCPEKYRDFKDYMGYKWYAVIEEFDLATHVEKMKEKHPNWTKRQCRNLLYWQNGVRKRLREKAYRNYHPLQGDVLLEIPEACGVNVFETMSKVGVIFQRSEPNYVIKVMLIGKSVLIPGGKEEEAN